MDITRTRLGLEPAVHDALALQCDAVVHAAASISYILPYADAGRPNVTGTQQVLAFCAHARVKPLHHVSSLSVHGAVGTLWYCWLTDQGISRRHDQPGQGHYFTVDVATRQVVHPWVPIDRIDLGEAAS